MNDTRTRRPVLDPALAWSQGLKVEAGGAGTVAHAGIVLPRLLGDRIGLTTGWSGVLARAGFLPGRDRGRAVVDAVCAMAAGASCLTDIEEMTSQKELFGPQGGASDSTLLRILNEIADRLNDDGLPGRRLAKMTAGVRAHAWRQVEARHGQFPAVKVAGSDLRRPSPGEGGPGRPVLVVRVDGTLIEAESSKEGAKGNWKGGFGFHPLGAWCTNVGDALAVMLRPGNAGSFTGADHLLVLKEALEQIPTPWRSDVLVTIDGAGASHEVIDYLTARNTAPEHGRRGRRLEYSIGWPVDDRTMSAITELSEKDWKEAISADGTLDPHAQVVDLTGILRQAPEQLGGDRMPNWPADQRVIARRVPRAPGDQAKLGEDPNRRYGPFTTNTPTGQIQWLDPRHRTQAHIEDKMKELKACGAANLPSQDWNRNSAWLQLAALATSLNAWLRHIALDGDLAKAEPKALRYRLFGAPARHSRHARTTTLKFPPGWVWTNTVTAAFARLQALHPA